MLTKTKIVLSSLLVIGFASAAMAQEAAKDVDKYPFLERTVQRTSAAAAYAYVPARKSVAPFTAEERALFERATHHVSSY